MWNGNNPLTYEDPSGYDVNYTGPGATKGSDTMNLTDQAVQELRAKLKSVDLSKHPEFAVLAQALDPNNHNVHLTINISSL